MQRIARQPVSFAQECSRFLLALIALVLLAAGIAGS